MLGAMANVEALVTWVAARGGVLHSRDLLAAGFTMHEMRSAVSSGALMRSRRSWLVHPSADPARLAAASVSGRVTCISASRSWGLWLPAGVDETPHIAVPHSASRVSRPGLVLHHATGPEPVGPTQLDDSLTNVLFHVARCVSPAAAIGVWESAIRRKLVSPEGLRRVKWRNARAARLAALAEKYSDSGLETEFVRLMRSVGVGLRQQVWIDGHPVDALVGERLVVQLDGFAHHSSPADRRRDIQADARLALLGYTVLRFDYHQIFFEPEQVVQTIRMAIAQGLHRAA
jgi:very-short-patch-repair endonuclease